jgi:hypothetical protein
MREEVKEAKFANWAFFVTEVIQGLTNNSVFSAARTRREEEERWENLQEKAKPLGSAERR